ncbi:MAG: succinylglutamate desuccinylase, partial [Noviherbaspirillum sp.]
FANAGFAVRLPARGILQLSASSRLPRRARLLLSVGVHGDETAPIEMLAQLLNALAAEPHALAVDLMVVVGNPEAVAQGKRFVDIDLNRLFRAGRDAGGDSVEERRADAIMRATAAFFAGAGVEKWHLDLHTAIRASHYPAFAVVPAAIGDLRRSAMLGLLACAGIGAAILNPAPAGTFSAYTAIAFGAASATLELGQVGQLGNNDLSRFADAQRTIDGFMREGKPPASGEAPHVFPHVFRVVQELIKHSDAFRMHIDRDVKNFTPLPPGTVIAEDGGTIYRVGLREEYVVFPNPDVRKGLRAGLMVVRGDT